MEGPSVRVVGARRSRGAWQTWEEVLGLVEELQEAPGGVGAQVEWSRLHQKGICCVGQSAGAQGQMERREGFGVEWIGLCWVGLRVGEALMDMRCWTWALSSRVLPRRPERQPVLPEGGGALSAGPSGGQTVSSCGWGFGIRRWKQERALLLKRWWRGAGQERPRGSYVLRGSKVESPGEAPPGTGSGKAVWSLGVNGAEVAAG